MKARVVHGWPLGCFAFLLFAAGIRLPVSGQDSANAVPPGVSVAMEQDFLARYEAAMKTAKASKDPSGLASYNALYAMDPSVPPEGKKAFEDFVVIAAGMDSVGTKPSYSIVPLSSDEKTSAEAPLTLAGKVYTGWLPPVISLKTTFAPPEHPDPSGMTMKGSSHPLCIENGRLMLIGIKCVTGAVPPPIDNPAQNFGLTPNHIKEGDVDDDQDFASLDKFLASLRQPGVEVLSSGQNDYVYYAICRVKPDLLVFVDSNRPGKDNFAYDFQITDSTHAQLTKDKNQVTLVEDPPGLDGKPVPVLQGDVYHPTSGYTGLITVVGNYGNDFSDLKPLVAKTVDWK